MDTKEFELNSINRKNDNYEGFLQQLRENFDNIVATGFPLFTTNAKDLFDLFLENLPVDARQHYNCNCCRSFINRYGGIVTISDNGRIHSALWNFDAPKIFVNAVERMREEVEDAVVNGVLLSDNRVVGTPNTGVWNHMSVKLPTKSVNTSRVKTAGQMMAEKKEDFRILSNALNEYTTDTISHAYDLVQSETLYRSDKVLGITEWVFNLKNKMTRNGETNRNKLWLAVATAPNGFCHIKSSMIGTLLDDIEDGLDVDAICRRFKEKMNPANYMRSQSAPTEGNIQRAEKIVQQLGIADSLERRYAKMEEIPEFLWKNKGELKRIEREQSNGVFGHITPKEKSYNNEMNLPTSVMTWEKFKRTVLPTAESVEAKVDNPNRLMALVTAQHEHSENIMQWDNPFSWYYHGGIDGEIKRRVEGAGGRYEDNEIRVSLIWESYTDLDIHCITPDGQHVFYGAKNDRYGGYLDIDMNAGGSRSKTPVENIRWSRNAPEGRYRFYVHNYSDRNGRYNPYKVELEVNGEVYTFEGVATGTDYQEDVFVFDYTKGLGVDIFGTSHSSNSSWSVPMDSFVKVTGVTNSPNTWGDNEVNHSGNHVFFLLDECKDMSEGKGRGFFNEMLKPELREIRKTLEAYSANTPIEGLDEASACGLGYSKDNEWNLTLKVKSKNSTRLIKIDRWD